jgi:hypothetical protein
MKALLLLLLTDCLPQQQLPQSFAETRAVNEQQSVYLEGQPVPAYDFSLERQRVIELYNARMAAVQTWSVWRSASGRIEGDCPSSGYPLPYGVQLTAPEALTYGSVLPQAEPNGLFTNGITSSATWVMCISGKGVSPVYVETNVTVYPFRVTVDYASDRVIPVEGAPSFVLNH